MVLALVTMFTLPVLAAEPDVSAESEIVIDVGTFTGIVTLVSMVVTQILKVIPAINDSKIAKVGISAAVGILVCIICWLLKVSPLLFDLSWWQALLYGLAAGLSGAGFYDIIQAIYHTFFKKTDYDYS